MSAVLFDVPGPKARARHMVGTVIAAVIMLAIIGWVLWTLYQEGEFEAELWEEMAQENIWRAYWNGIVATLSAAASGIVLSVIYGAVFAAARLSDHAWVRWPALVIVEFLRAVPLLLLIVFLFIAFPELGRYWALVLALMLYNGSVLSEVFRAGINAVPRGQSEAAYAVGMRKNQVMRLVLLPQAVSIMLPAIISQCVIVLKDTALGVFIAYQELVRESQGIAEFVDHAIVPLTIAAIIFIIINYALSRLAIWVERRMARRGHSAAKRSTAADASLTMDQTGGA